MDEPAIMVIPSIEDVLDWDVTVDGSTKPIRFLTSDELRRLSKSLTDEHTPISDLMADTYSGLELAVLAHSVATVGDLPCDVFEAMFWGLDDDGENL